MYQKVCFTVVGNKLLLNFPPFFKEQPPKENLLSFCDRGSIQLQRLVYNKNKNPGRYVLET